MFVSVISNRQYLAFALAAAVLGIAASSVEATYVLPQMGGGQVGMGNAPMVHADVTFDGVNLAVSLHVEPHELPMLRALTPPDAFDPTEPWAVLTDKAYNFQYAWNAGGFITLPAGSGIWIERLHHDDGLEAYLRAPAAPAWSAVFTADGDRWMWSGAMTHNVYAVLDPLSDHYQAMYRVYLGDAATGQPLPGYGSADVTWTWHAAPVPEPTTLAIGLFGLGGLVGGRERR